MEQLALTIAKDLLEIQAVFLKPNDPFTWTSGMKSPIYCDNRLTLSYPEVRGRIADGLVSVIKDHFPKVNVIAGTATAGIPHAALVSERLQLPMVYVRSSAKKHGKGNQIEGKIAAGENVVVIEDLISTGGSVINAANALREAGANVLGVAAIFSYGLEKGITLLNEANLTVHTLTNLDALMKAAAEGGEIDATGQEMIKKWSQDPESIGWLKRD
ncbi:orotate phosphoribosyltransferase [Pueribacillus theae]|uniref:Orotate phosphoribosyltransferase n=1 Tax=Pueribacillus theae TaxID=2171751 RepID=A0A2U1K7D5_9BACI|nr:orotate phosphoribosyltransferase [Pueribacillus theae]PWA13440.1 orotate phosphoribosyltransferase [Pueribacillus theae]